MATLDATTFLINENNAEIHVDSVTQKLLNVEHITIMPLNIVYCIVIYQPVSKNDKHLS